MDEGRTGAAAAVAAAGATRRRGRRRLRARVVPVGVHGAGPEPAAPGPSAGQGALRGPGGGGAGQLACGRALGGARCNRDLRRRPRAGPARVRLAAVGRHLGRRRGRRGARGGPGRLLRRGWAVRWPECRHVMSMKPLCCCRAKLPPLTAPLSPNPLTSGGARSAARRLAGSGPRTAPRLTGPVIRG